MFLWFNSFPIIPMFAPDTLGRILLVIIQRFINLVLPRSRKLTTKLAIDTSLAFRAMVVVLCLRKRDAVIVRHILILHWDNN